MKPITLNLASRPFRNNTLLAAVMTFVGVSLVGATAYNLYVYIGYGSAYARLQQEQATDRAKITRLQVDERRLADEVRTRNFKHAYERGKLASELVRKSAFSWTRLFNTLEAVVPPDVVMTAIRPNIGADEIDLRIEGVAKNSAAFLSLQTRLMESPWFTRVFPGSERRLNPSLPDISFLLTCNYLPEGMMSPDKVATTGAASPTAAGSVADPAAAAGVPDSPGQPPATASATKPVPATDASLPVGRDGRPLAERAAMTFLAPGGVQVGAVEEPGASGKRGGKAAGKPKRTPGAEEKKASPPAAPATAAAAPAKRPAAPPAGNPGPAASLNAPAPEAAAGTPDPLPAKTIGAAPGYAGPLDRTDAAGRTWDPNLARTAPPTQQASRAAQLKPPVLPAAAERLDLPLSFTATPVGEVYDRLAVAHGVRFRIDPGLDRALPITLNLNGRRLEDALALVAGVARHRVRRIADGSYTVVAVGADGVMADQPVAEEPLGEDAP